MNYLFACGGTAGHINPAVGVAGRIRELLPDSKILFIGAEGKMEAELVPREGYEIRLIPVSNMSRSLSLEGLRHNVRSVKDLAASLPATRRILREFRPDVVVGTGGYVCYPVLSEAARMGIPTAVHESNAEPGLTTRLLEKKVDRIMVGFEEARQNYKDPSKVAVTGTPVRLGFMRADRAEARAKLGIPENEPLALSVWGSLGATEMNKTVARMIALAMEDRPFRFVHSAGKRGIDGMARYMAEDLGLSGWEEAGFSVEYVSGVPSFCAAAARLCIPLAERDEPLHIIPAFHTGEGLNLPGNCVLMKSGRRIGEVKEALLRSGRKVSAVENCTMKDERVFRRAEEIPDDAGYFTLVIAK